MHRGSAVKAWLVMVTENKKSTSDLIVDKVGQDTTNKKILAMPMDLSNMLAEAAKLLSRDLSVVLC